MPIQTSSKLARNRLAAVLLATMSSACANTKGDQVTCPTCDNTTQLLSGTKCVPLVEIDVCGPDGHAHGTACHCNSGQAPTAIGGMDYCLQLTCGSPTVDVAALACDEAARAADPVTAVASLAEVDTAHVPIGKVAEVTLPAGQEAYVHFEAEEAGELHVFASTTGMIQGALTGAGTALVAANEGANEDCPSPLPEVWGVQATAAGAVVLRLKSATAATVKLLVYEASHAL